MHKIVLPILSILFISFSSFSQKKYFQQHTSHTIHVQLDDVQHISRGHCSIVYKNNSPDTLQFIYLHLYPNAYKNDRTAFTEQMVQQGSTDFYFNHQKKMAI
jgi:hypothetical protein